MHAYYSKASNAIFKSMVCILVQNRVFELNNVEHCVEGGRGENRNYGKIRNPKGGRNGEVLVQLTFTFCSEHKSCLQTRMWDGC